MTPVRLRFLTACAAAMIGLACQSGPAVAQADFRPQWKDAGPQRGPAAQPEYRSPEAPRTLPVLPAPEVHPTARDEQTGLALHGFDPVAYFTEQKAITGQVALEAVVNGETWRFAQAANQRIFESRPDRYRPRFGGFDAEGVARGVVVNADPQIFLVLGDALFLFRTPEARGLFMAEPALRARAEANWPSIKGDSIR